MTWINPGALAGLVLVLLPVVVHLLVRRHAARVRFPAMRFVPAVRAAAVRLRAPSDLALLLMRMGVIAAAVIATAQPVLTTAARRRAWDARVARAVIVDRSASVSQALATELARSAADGAFVSHRFDTSDLRDAVRRTTEWLADAPAARREIAIVSDFQRGSIGEADLAAVATSTGLTFVRAGRPHAANRAAVIDGWRGSRWEGSLSVDDTATQVTWTRRPASPSLTLTVRAAADDRTTADRAAEAAQLFGVPAAHPARRVEVSFAGASELAGAAPRTPWIVSAAIAMQSSGLLAQTGAQGQVGERDGMMTVKTALPASSPFAPAVIRAALLAAAPPTVDAEAEPAAIDDGVLARWRRPPVPIASRGADPDSSDGRWLWALALVLLLVEARVRRRDGAVQEDAHADAA